MVDMTNNLLQEINNNETHGRILIETESGSKHILNFDPDGWNYRRAQNQEDPYSVPLRKDDDTVALKGVESCRLNESCILVLHGVNDSEDVITIRQTTPVVSILRLED